MIANYVGDEVFFKGVSIYLKKHLFGNSVADDLWDAIGQVTGLDIAKIMDSWVKKVLFFRGIHTPRGDILLGYSRSGSLWSQFGRMKKAFIFAKTAIW